MFCKALNSILLNFSQFCFNCILFLISLLKISVFTQLILCSIFHSKISFSYPMLASTSYSSFLICGSCSLSEFCSLAQFHSCFSQGRSELKLTLNVRSYSQCFIRNIGCLLPSDGHKTGTKSYSILTRSATVCV